MSDSDDGALLYSHSSAAARSHAAADSESGGEYNNNNTGSSDDSDDEVDSEDSDTSELTKAQSKKAVAARQKEKKSRERQLKAAAYPEEVPLSPTTAARFALRSGPGPLRCAPAAPRAALGRGRRGALALLPFGQQPEQAPLAPLLPAGLPAVQGGGGDQQHEDRR